MLKKATVARPYLTRKDQSRAVKILIGGLMVSAIMVISAMSIPMTRSDVELEKKIHADKLRNQFPRIPKMDPKSPANVDNFPEVETHLDVPPSLPSGWPVGEEVEEIQIQWPKANEKNVVPVPQENAEPVTEDSDIPVSHTPVLKKKALPVTPKKTAHDITSKKSSLPVMEKLQEQILDPAVEAIEPVVNAIVVVDEVLVKPIIESGIMIGVEEEVVEEEIVVPQVAGTEHEAPQMGHTFDFKERMPLADYMQVQNKIYAKLTGHATSEEERKTMDMELGGDASIYGEILPSTLDDLVKGYNLTPWDSFVDIGMGIGKAVTQMALTYNVESYGIEYSRHRYDVAMTAYMNLKQLQGSENVTPLIHFKQGDATLQENFPKDHTPTITYGDIFMWSEENLIKVGDVVLHSILKHKDFTHLIVVQASGIPNLEARANELGLLIEKEIVSCPCTWAEDQDCALYDIAHPDALQVKTS